MSTDTVSLNRQKRAAARAAALLISPGMKVGLGTGSTATHLVEALGEAYREGALPGLVTVATSERTAAQARSVGLPLVDLSEVDALDLTIDGADEVDANLDLVKGLGGAALREKIVACASARMVVMVDSSKMVERLGSTAPVPVEVEPFGWESTRRALEALGCRAERRMSGADPFRTDGGHFIVDCRFERIDDASALERRIKGIPGALECGLFVGIAKQVLVGEPDGAVRSISRPA